jgi:predicted O-linked N-acetylglucosamine transferase (SPINDLY family)
VKADPVLAAGVAELVDLLAAGQLPRATVRAAELLLRYPQDAELWRLRAICSLQAGDLDTAESELTRAHRLAPDSVEVLCNLASVQRARGRSEDAERLLREALRVQPGHAAAWNNLGSLLDARGDTSAAADCFARAVAAQPDYAAAWLNRAGTLLTLRDLAAAEQCARRALQLAPQWSEALFLLGNILREGRQLATAEAAYRQALQHAPPNPRFEYQHALVLDELGDYAQALQAYQRAAQLDPGFWPALSQWVYLKRRMCDWDGLGPLAQRLGEGVARGAAGITPFSFLAEASTPALQLDCAREFARLKRAEVAPLAQRLAFAAPPRRAGPIRVGFVSSGFGEHPTSLLIVELIERLRASSLQTLAFATTADDGGPLRARLRRAFHRFDDLSGLAVQSMLSTIREAEVDILIDLDGYCQDSHPELFALRAAPLQVNWLAYPGSLGAGWYDYLIADHYLIPPQQRSHYAEKIAWLPHCYQPTDTTRVVPAAGARADHGLAADQFVFASFNNSWKFTPQSFARWMQILAAVPASVLWLLSGPTGSGVEERLRRAASTAGIDPVRLVFAARVGHADHLARQRHADLFLDTNPYNAHTTASDALWAGCPLLTRPGDTFSSRVAGSINHALGLDLMNAPSDAAYVDTAVRLARDPGALRDLRRRVESARRQQPMFDMARYARDFAALLTAMFKRREAGYDAIDLETP